MELSTGLRVAFRGSPNRIAMYLSNQSLLVIIAVGIVAGWLAGQVMRGTGFGLIGDLAVGLIGAYIGAVLVIPAIYVVLRDADQVLR